MLQGSPHGLCWLLKPFPVCDWCVNTREDCKEWQYLLGLQR